MEAAQHSDTYPDFFFYIEQCLVLGGGIDLPFFFLKTVILRLLLLFLFLIKRLGFRFLHLDQEFRTCEPGSVNFGERQGC